MSTTRQVPKNWEECHQYFLNHPTSFKMTDHSVYQAWNSVFGLRIHMVYIKELTEIMCTLVDYDNVAITLSIQVTVDKFTSDLHKLSESVYVMHTTSHNIVLNLLKLKEFRLLVLPQRESIHEFNFRLCQMCQTFNYGPNNIEITNQPHLLKIKDLIKQQIQSHEINKYLPNEKSNKLIIKTKGTLSLLVKNYDGKLDLIFNSLGKSIEFPSNSITHSFREKCGPFFVSSSALIHSETFEQFTGSMLLKCLKFCSNNCDKIITIDPTFAQVLVRVMILKPETKRFAIKKNCYFGVDNKLHHFYHFDEESQKVFCMKFDGSYLKTLDVK